MKTVLVAGELNVDLILRGYASFPEPGKEILVDDCALTLGSASAICAMGLARLGTKVAFLGIVGDDPWGGFCLESLKSRAIDVSRVRTEGALHTGITVAIASPGDRALVTFLGASAALTGSDLSDDILAVFQHLHVSSYFLQRRLRPSLGDVFARATRLGLTTSLDPGYDPSETWGEDLGPVLAQVDVFLPNEAELRGLVRTSDLEEALRTLENGRTLTVAKLGSEGAAALESGRLLRVPAFLVTPVDTTGAGDSFGAGFLDAWLRGEPLESALRQGAACGALSTLGLGGIARQPDRAEAQALLASR
jgi:sugar/nucleoside kinase (ribokinase family)